MLEAIAECQAFVAGMTAQELRTDPKTLKAVVWNLMIMGEAARQIPPEVEAAYAEVPWTTIRGMRNHIVHGYDVIDIEIVLNVVQDRLPPLVPILKRIEQETVE